MDSDPVRSPENGGMARGLKALKPYSLKERFRRLLSDKATLQLAEATLSGETPLPFWKRIVAFLGPAFVASVAYMDPGNFATNISGGARYGYMLLWVILLSNLIAMLIQALSAKLGIATGRSLPELIRDEFPKPLVIFFWIQAEVIAMATDLAEFLGAALGLNLLLGIPLLPAAMITGVLAFLILDLERYGFRPLEIAITMFIGVIAICYLIEIWLARPNGMELVMALVPPRLTDTESVLLAVGILGATVMPHVIYLHSALTQGRIVAQSPERRRRIFRFELYDVILALGTAGLINAAMLIMAAATFHRSGYREFLQLTDAYVTLQPLLGPFAATAFAIALLASGLSSSTVGTMAGQIIMQGFVHWRIPRRGFRPHPGAGSEPGDPFLRDPLRPDPADLVHPASRFNGTSCEQPAHNDRRQHRRCFHYRPQPVPPLPDICGMMLPGCDPAVPARVSRSPLPPTPLPRCFAARGWR